LRSVGDIAILTSMIPEKIGRYEVKEELGRGGMATVYRAYDPRFEREVAVKVLPREMLHDPQFRVRFEREAKTIAMLEHSAIVPVYDFGEEDGQPYFVMRYMSGGSLSDRIKRNRLSVQQAARMVERLAPALDDAHAKGIIHRDLKPGNILYDQREDPYVSDFGIAKLAESSSNMTGSAIIGTPAYMSPEQAQGDAIDGRSDIYALGVILFEALSGKQPYEADTPMGVVVKHITEPVPHILDANPGLPPAIEAVVEKAMAKKRDERFGSAGELSAALNAVASIESPDQANATVVGLPRRSDAPATQPPVRIGTDMDATIAASPIPKKKGKVGGWLVAALLGLIVVGAGVIALVAGGMKFLPLVFQKDTLTPVSVAVSPTDNEVQENTPANSPTPESLPASETPNIQAASPEPPTATSTPDVPLLPVLGGADQVAFINANNIWTMNMDGGNLQKVTTDGTIKMGLQWLPSGDSFIYITGKCIQVLNLTTLVVSEFTCFPYADALDAFEVSPDGSQVAVSLNHELFVVPFDPALLKDVHTSGNLLGMKGCFTIQKTIGTTRVRWSQDGQKIALGIWGVVNKVRTDMVRVLDISGCDSLKPMRLDEFPGGFFTMDGYGKNPVIPSYNWDGQDLFLLNSTFFNGIFGPLYKYNMSTHKAEKINPIDDTCCYLDASWSPDRSYIFFAFSDIRQGGASQTQFYYIPFGTIGNKASYDPIPLPPGFFKNQREDPQPVLRPARP
jgi:serine/threonine protein kinase